MRFTQWLAESYRFRNGVQFLVNPSSPELAAYVRAHHNPSDHDFTLRGLLYGNDLYFWVAKLMTHQQAANALFFSDYLNYRLTVYLNSYNEVVVDCTPEVASSPRVRSYGLDDDGVLPEN